MTKFTFFTIIVVFCVLSQLRTTESALISTISKRLGKLAGKVFTRLPGISEVTSVIKTAKDVWGVVSPLVDEIRGKKGEEGTKDAKNDSEQINLLTSKTDEILPQSNRITQDIMQLNTDISNKLNQSAIANEAIKLELLLGINKSIDNINQLKADITSEFNELYQSKAYKQW